MFVPWPPFTSEKFLTFLVLRLVVEKPENLDDQEVETWISYLYSQSLSYTPSNRDTAAPNALMRARVHAMTNVLSTYLASEVAIVQGV